MSSDHIQWIAIDWGTSNLRGWAMSDSGRILDQANSEQGMATVNATDEDFESALLDLILDLHSRLTRTGVCLQLAYIEFSRSLSARAYEGQNTIQANQYTHLAI